MAPSTKRCLCKAHGCWGASDRVTGEPGVPLTAHAFRKHQRDEAFAQSANLEGNAAVAQNRILLAEEDALEIAMQQLSVQDSRSSPEISMASLETKYMADKKREMLRHIGIILDNIKTREGRIQLIDVPDIEYTELKIGEAIQTCREVCGLNDNAARELALSNHGPTRKQPCIRDLRYTAHARLSQIVGKVKTVEAAWERRLEERTKRHDKIRNSVPTQYNSSHHFQPTAPGAAPFMQVVNLMMVVCYVILGYSRRGTQWLFAMCEYAITEVADKLITPVPNWLHQILSAFPRDVRAATNRFNIEGKHTIYAACPKCNEVYKPDMINNIPIYPERCNLHRYGSKCGELLVRPKTFRNRLVYVPIKPYISFDFQDWLAGMLSREGHEQQMDAAWKRMNRPPSSNDSMHDIFQSGRIRNFTGRNGKHFSESGELGTGRYLFSLGFDFFNPLRNLVAGKKVSIGVIALTCLNLPIEVRYKPENMFLAGIIPGPKEPPLNATNPYFRPIVDAFLMFWMGVFFTKTALYEMGRVILCALLTVICDLPAARKAGGFSSFKQQYFCTLCWCNRTQHTYNDYDYRNWKPRTDQECRDGASRYERASSAREANSHFDKSGLRSSEFLRLPYYSPTRSLVVDPMHNLFLGLIKEHFQYILGEERPKNDKKKKKKQNTEKDVSDDGVRVKITPTVINPIPTSKSGRAGVSRIQKWLQSPLPACQSHNGDWAKCLAEKNNAEAIIYIGKGLGCIADTISSNAYDTSKPSSKRIRKNVLTKKILEWRVEYVKRLVLESTSVEQNTSVSSVAGRHGHIITEKEMEALRRDIKSMVKPSWATSLPSTMSSSSGKLKSDQWRVAASLYFPITLIRLWSHPGDDSKDAKRHQELLHLTMLLFEAVSIITSRVASKAQADEYLLKMIKYREELTRIFPTYECLPNHHMALHVGEFLIDYGPVHGWWTFPFERMIGMLQRISTNYKQGQYEKTIALTWHRRSNLRSIFSKLANSNSIIRYCRPMFEELVSPQGRNFLANDAEIPDEEGEEDIRYDDDEENDTDEPDSDDEYNVENERQLQGDVVNAFRRQYGQSPTAAISVNRHRVNRVSYTSHSIHEGNSGVLDRSEIPYQIQKILKLRAKLGEDNVWLVVRRHRQVTGNVVDPYAGYIHLRAKMWSVEVEERIEVVPFSAIVGHFAKCVIPWNGENVAVCVSLSRFRPA